MATQFEWIDFYTEFATKLLEYQKNRKALIGKIQNVYNKIGQRLPKLENSVVPVDIDPFTVFGLFNKGITIENRIRIISGIKREFSIAAIVPSVFDGIPSLNNQAATFYYFDDQRGERDIDNLWDVFASAIELSESDNEQTRTAFSVAYDKCLPQKGVKWNLSMGLFWIRPLRFINLDSRNRWYFINGDGLSGCAFDQLKAMKDVPSGVNYLKICDILLSEFKNAGSRFKNFPDLSSEAWRVSLEADKQEELEKQKPNALGDADVERTQYWLYAPGEGAGMWEEFYKQGIMGYGDSELGDLSVYNNKSEISEKFREVYGTDSSFKNLTHAAWQFIHDIKPGDIVFVKKGRYEILGRGVVESDYQYDESRGEYPNIRQVRWLNKGSWKTEEMLAMKTLTDLTDYTNFVSKINSFFEVKDVVGPEEVVVEPEYPSYTKEDFLSEVYMSSDSYDTMVDVLKNKMNIILQGAPGVGKTFVAKRLAYSIMGVKDVDRVMMVQFHQSYSYEDFIMGFRPSISGFELKKGTFYNFCKKAADDSDNDYFFIIDEINRGNLSKIFGELFMLVENDKRGSRNKLQLLYSDELFYIPENVYIIGMMNTADRSLAMMDYALRRRFAFIDLKPAFRSEQFKSYRHSLNNHRFDSLLQFVESLNERIASDDSLGEGFCIGHSYFCNIRPDELNEKKLSNIVEFELIPMLKEYWFDEPVKVKEWSDNLRSAIR